MADDSEERIRREVAEAERVRREVAEAERVRREVDDATRIQREQDEYRKIAEARKAGEDKRQAEEAAHAKRMDDASKKAARDAELSRGNSAYDSVVRSMERVKEMNAQLEALGSQLPPPSIREFLEPTLPSFLASPPIYIPPTPPTMPHLSDSMLASGFYKRIVEWINEFQRGLDADTEVGVNLVSFGRDVVFHLTDITYYNPQLLRFDGIDTDGQPVHLIQHVTQISVLLKTVPKIGPTARRIGFHLNGDDSPSPDQAP